MESVKRLFTKRSNLTTVEPSNAFTVAEAEKYFVRCQLKPSLHAIESFVGWQLLKTCPVHKEGTDVYDRLKSVLVFRVACELDVPYWSTNRGENQGTLKGLLTAERKLLDDMWTKDPIDNPEFYTLGLHRGTSLQLVIALEGDERKCLVKELSEASGVKEFRQVSISECVEKRGKGTFSTPFRDLIANYPEFAVAALNNSLHFSKQQDPMQEGRGFKLDKITYSIVDDFGSAHHLRGNSSEEVTIKGPHSPVGPTDFSIDCGTNRFYDRLDHHSLWLISRSDNSIVVNHPIVQLFVCHMWGKVRWYYYGQLLLFLPYLISLNVFVLGESSYMMSTSINQTEDVLSFPRDSVFTDLPTYVCLWLLITLLFSVLGLVSLGYRLIRLGSAQETEMSFEEMSYGCVAFYSLYIVRHVNKVDGLDALAIISGAVGCCLSWITFMLYCRMLPVLGLQIEIFISIFKRYLMCMPVGFLLLFGFGSSFVILFRNVPMFNSVHTTFIVAAQIVFAQITTNDVLDSADGYRHFHNNNAAYLITVYLFMFGFLVLGALTFVNMLTGLATDDVKKILELAEDKLYRQKLKMSVDFAHFHQILTRKDDCHFLITIMMKFLAFCNNYYNWRNSIRLANEKELNTIISQAVETHMSSM